MEVEPILHVWVNHDNDLVDLTITPVASARHGNATTHASEVIHTNQKHPFFTQEKGFLPVGQADHTGDAYVARRWDVWRGDRLEDCA